MNEPPLYIEACADNGSSVIQRDHRLTGTMRGQTDNTHAPFGFELSSKWKVHIVTNDAADQC